MLSGEYKNTEGWTDLAGLGSNSATVVSESSPPRSLKSQCCTALPSPTAVPLLASPAAGDIIAGTVQQLR